MSDIWDFGFTAVTEQELDAVQSKDIEKQALSDNLDECQRRLDNLQKAFVPLLENLKQDPDKEYIWWPNRIEKVEKFEKYLQEVYNGRG